MNLRNDYRLRVIAVYRARASDSLDRAWKALEIGEFNSGRLHLDEAQAWAQFACQWAHKAFAAPETFYLGDRDHD